MSDADSRWLVSQTGANLVYTPETGISLSMLQQDVEFLKKRYTQDVAGKSEGRLVIRSEKASKTYSTEVLTKILGEEGSELFDARFVALGHTLQGGVPSPRDRTRAIRLTVKCIDFLELHHKRKLQGLPVEWANPDMGTIVIEGAGIRFARVEEMNAAADHKMRRGKYQWWGAMRSLVETMAGRINLDEVRARL